MPAAPSRVLVLAVLCFTACTGAVSGYPDDGTAGAPSHGGTTGSAGGPGVAGASGAAGNVSTTGAAGTTGAGGSLGGAAGSDSSGTAGTTGAAGNGGTTGTAGAAGTTGGAGRGGTNGSAGTTGTAGRGGATGSAGTVGTAGITGTAGTTGAGGSGGNSGNSGMSGDPPGYVPALVGVGYGGIRIVSRDGGKTWGDRAYETTNGGDDDVLIRAVVYGKGLWVATGWKLWTSTDGVKWVDHGKLQDGPVKSCAIIEGLAFKDDSFYGVCDGKVFKSIDGLTWTKISTIPNTGSHVYLIYRGGKFVAYGDTMTSYQSDDALTWTTMAGIDQATYCENTWKSQTDCKDSSWYDGTYLRADWQGKISRSTNGTSFSTVYNDDQKNTLYQSRAIAAGFVAPK